jgi:hypothetical protein
MLIANEYDLHKADENGISLDIDQLHSGAASHCSSIRALVNPTQLTLPKLKN